MKKIIRCCLFLLITIALFGCATTEKKVSKISYYVEGSVNITLSPNTYEEGKGLVLPIPNLKSYEIFDGWYEDRTYKGDKVTKITKEDTGDKVYYGRILSKLNADIDFNKNNYRYTISSKSNGEVTSTTYSYNQGNIAVEIADETQYLAKVNNQYRYIFKQNNSWYYIPETTEGFEYYIAYFEILKLNIGNPAPFGFKAPQELVDMMRGNLENAEGYSDSRGLLKSRQAIVEYCKKKNIPNVGVNDIYTGNGVSELITLSMNGLLDNGDEVLVPSPDYPLWTASVTLAGGKAVHNLCDEQTNSYQDIADMRKKITDKTKGIVIINPNNPTGALYPKEILEQIVELAREHELLIFADEIYDRLVMDGKQHISIASLAPDLCVVSFNGLSKSHLIAGYRCGWMCISGDKSRAKGYIEGINLLSSMRLCANVPTQSVIPKALEMLDSTKEMLEPGGRVYEQREYIYNALNDIPGVSAVKPEAAFYIFPKMDMKKFHIKDDEKFALDFLKEKKILVTHGGGFHWNTPDHFRIVYLPDVDTLTEACTRMKDFFAHYVQD